MTGSAFFALVLILLLAAASLLLLLTRMLRVCQPNEVLVFSGRRRRLPDGRVKGYRVIRGGRALKVPLVERVDRMDLTNMIIDVQVHNAYSRGGIPLTVQGVANIKIPGEEPLLDNALERFLGHGRERIQKFAQDTLEGNLRGVLATLTPEEVNQDKERFAVQLTSEAEHDFNRLGLVLDTLKIQNVSDELGYLDAIGRQLSAEIRRDAQIAEAEARAEAAERKWDNQRGAEVAKLAARIEIARKENERRIADAETGREASIATQEAQVRALIVQAQAQLETQSARVEQVRRRLEADVLQPAEAKKREAEEKAKAEAAEVVARGKATATVLTDLAHGYAHSGAEGRDALLMQKILPVTRKLARAGALEVKRWTVLGGGSSGGSNGLARGLVEAREQVRAATGLDVEAWLRERLGAPTPPATPAPAARESTAEPQTGAPALDEVPPQAVPVEASTDG